MGSFLPLQEHYIGWRLLFGDSGAVYAPQLGIHQCHDFLHEGAPPRKSKLVKMLQEDREIWKFGSGQAIFHI